MATLYRYRFGSVVFDESRQELVVSGLTVEIQRRPLQILSLLLAHGGEVIPRQQFFDQLWEGRPTVENVLANAVAKLRNALGSEGGLIENVPRRGYRFVGRFERTPIFQPQASRLELSAGQRVPLRGDFALDRLLSQSNGQEVWLANEVAGVRQRVFKFAATAERMSTLKREVTIARVLRDELGVRPDIISIVGWNFEAAPFFVESEFGGEDLLCWASRDEQLTRATEAGRLDLIIQMAEAVAAAHSVAILHRDLKPENVLVSTLDHGGLQIRLIDFGSGRLLEPERLAELGITALGMTVTEGAPGHAAAGTLMYLAPELLREQPATIGTDLYALGVLLYQVLIGDLRRPLGEGWERGIADPLLRESIAKAVESDPELRAASVQEWRDELVRLDQRRQERALQVAAQRQAQHNLETLRRIRARRPWLVATILALVLGLSGALWLYARVLQGQRELSAQYEVARALNSFLTQNFIAVANPAATGRKDVSVIEAARSAATEIDSVFANADPAVRGGLHAAMQEAFAGLSDYGASLAEGQKALQALLAARPQDPARIAEVRIRIADGLTESSKLDEATAQLREAARLIREGRLEETAIAARYWWSVGGIEIDQLAMPQAVSHYRLAWELAQRHPELPANVRDSMHYLYADALRMSDRQPEAEREASALRDSQAARLGRRHPLTCHTDLLLSSIYGYMGRTATAIPLAQQAAQCLTDTLGATNIRTVSGYFVVGDLQFQAGHYDEAAVAYDHAADGYSKLLGPNAQRSINQRMNAAVSRQYAGHPVDAEKALSANLETARAALGWTHPTVQEIRYHLADCRLDLRHTEGVQQLLDGLSIAQLNESAAEPDWEGRLAYEAGRLALYDNNPERAATLLEKAARITAEKHPDGRVTEAAIRQLIGQAQSSSGRLAVTHP